MEHHGAGWCTREEMFVSPSAVAAHTRLQRRGSAHTPPPPERTTRCVPQITVIPLNNFKELILYVGPVEVRVGGGDSTLTPGTPAWERATTLGGRCGGNGHALDPMCHASSTHFSRCVRAVGGNHLLRGSLNSSVAKSVSTPSRGGIQALSGLCHGRWNRFAPAHLAVPAHLPAERPRQGQTKADAGRTRTGHGGERRFSQTVRNGARARWCTRIARPFHRIPPRGMHRNARPARSRRRFTQGGRARPPQHGARVAERLGEQEGCAGVRRGHGAGVARAIGCDLA
eukprot:gene7514-biopygen22